MLVDGGLFGEEDCGVDEVSFGLADGADFSSSFDCSFGVGLEGGARLGDESCLADSDALALVDFRLFPQFLQDVSSRLFSPQRSQLQT